MAWPPPRAWRLSGARQVGIVRHHAHRCWRWCGGSRRAARSTSAADHDHIEWRLRTLEECALHEQTLHLTCSKCGHVRVLDAVARWWKFCQRRWDGRLGSVGQRLCCSACQPEGHTLRPHVVIGRDRRPVPLCPIPTSPRGRSLSRATGRDRTGECVIFTTARSILAAILTRLLRSTRRATYWRSKRITRRLANPDTSSGCKMTSGC